MSTALEEMERAQLRRQSDIWGDRVAYFIREYAPEDQYRRMEFERDFHALMMQGWHEAQRPLLERLTTLISSLPIGPLFK